MAGVRLVLDLHADVLMLCCAVGCFGALPCDCTGRSPSWWCGGPGSKCRDVSRARDDGAVGSRMFEFSIKFTAT